MWQRPGFGLTPGLNHEETYVSVRDDFCQALLRLGARPVLLPLDAGEAVLQDVRADPGWLSRSRAAAMWTRSISISPAAPGAGTSARAGTPWS